MPDLPRQPLNNDVVINRYDERDRQLTDALGLVSKNIGLLLEAETAMSTHLQANTRRMEDQAKVLDRIHMLLLFLAVFNVGVFVVLAIAVGVLS